MCEVCAETCFRCIGFGRIQGHSVLLCFRIRREPPLSTSRRVSRSCRRSSSPSLLARSTHIGVQFSTLSLFRLAYLVSPFYPTRSTLALARTRKTTYLAFISCNQSAVLPHQCVQNWINSESSVVCWIIYMCCSRGDISMLNNRSFSSAVYPPKKSGAKNTSVRHSSGWKRPNWFLAKEPNPST